MMESVRCTIDGMQEGETSLGLRISIYRGIPGVGSEMHRGLCLGTDSPMLYMYYHNDEL